MLPGLWLATCRRLLREQHRHPQPANGVPADDPGWEVLAVRRTAWRVNEMVDGLADVGPSHIVGDHGGIV